ncbi:hypothetical protein [Pseudomonas pharyngis]|uniref:hypothetical protein n=1 Tax=Pseudomonas pharyngis TaxID=2892333 RepID=UPI001F2594B8|nr:hypothetical protein [Pseudomonas pharyngis]
MKTISYEFSECNGSVITAESPFFIHERVAEFPIIFRVLSGSCQITNLNTDESAVLSKNYFYSDIRNNENRDLSFFDEFDEDLKLSDYERLVKRTAWNNRKFYQPFLNELASCIYHEEGGRHTAAFVHLYRSYEHLSYAFPMIYASRTQDYVGTFENLRKWMNNDSDGNAGELKFHKTFVVSLFKGMPELSRTIDVEINTKQEYREPIFKALAEKIAGWKNLESYTPATNRPDRLAIPFAEYHSFFVTLRNRFFHYSNARSDNIGLDDIVEADLLFSFINKITLNYIATIFHGVMKHQLTFD